MPLVSGKQLIDTYSDILNGRRELVVWGVRDNFFLNRWQALLPVKYVVDANWRLWDSRIDGLSIFCPLVLENENPKHIALMIDYSHRPTLDDIIEFVDDRIKLPMLIPAPMDEIYRLFRPRNQSSISLPPAKALNTIERHLISTFNRNDAWKKAPQFISADKFKSNVRLFSSYELKDVVQRYKSQINKTSQNSGLKANPKKILLLNPNLNLGGSQRQLMNLAASLKKNGLTPTFMILNTDRPFDSYARFMEKNHVPIHSLSPSSKNTGHVLIEEAPDNLAPEKFFKYMRRNLPENAQFILWHIPQPFLFYILKLYMYLKKNPVGLIIAYLDWSNVIAVMAGLLAGTPRIIMTGRNVSPLELPHFFKSDLSALHNLYKVALNQPNVYFANNSDAGAASYAAWLKIKASQIRVIPNCLTYEFETLATSTQKTTTREQHGIAADAPLIVGAFRFSPEKEPITFLKVVAGLYRRIPQLRVVICGDGAMEKDMRQFIKSKKLEKCVIIVPATPDIRNLMAAASLILLTSNAEGAPNILLECQAQQVPAITTRAGGVKTNLYPSLWAYTAPVSDVKKLVHSCMALLGNDPLRKKLGREARRFVLKNFSRENLLKCNLELAGYKLSKEKKN